jgi:sulfite reductase beta subunit-like hemoprotein
MADAAALAEEFAAPGQGQIVLSNKQNLIFLNIPHARVDTLVKRLEAVGLSPHAPLWRTNLVSCTGTQFCNLAIVETKQRAAKILKYLEDEVQVDSPIMVSVTGCPNSCAQYQIADIGLMGVVCNFRGQRGTEAFNILLGGALGQDAHFGKLTLKKVPADYVHLAIGNLAKAYMSERVDEEELFSSFIARNPPEKLAQWLTIPEMAEVV